MNVIPTKVNANSDDIQSAMLHHVMRRLTEPTILQREGSSSILSDNNSILGIYMLGTLRPVLEKMKNFEVKLEMFAHPTDYDKCPVSFPKS